jgi:hypothetical protein
MMRGKNRTEVVRVNEAEMILLIEAAKELRVSMATLYRTLGREQIQTFRRIGDRRAYIRVSDLDRIRGFRPTDEGKAAA